MGTFFKCATVFSVVLVTWGVVWGKPNCCSTCLVPCQSQVHIPTFHTYVQPQPQIYIERVHYPYPPRVPPIIVLVTEERDEQKVDNTTTPSTTTSTTPSMTASTTASTITTTTTTTAPTRELICPFNEHNRMCTRQSSNLPASCDFDAECEAEERCCYDKCLLSKTCKLAYVVGK